MIKTIEDKKRNITYLHSHNLGFAIKSRVGEAVEKGYLSRDNNLKDYVLTYRSTEFKNFWQWLQGDQDTLVRRKPEIPIYD